MGEGVDTLRKILLMGELPQSNLSFIPVPSSSKLGLHFVKEILYFDARMTRCIR